MTNTISAKPFIKWAGGKGQLLSQLEQHFPQIIYDKEFAYFEPFVGGGAMLFFMLQKFPNIRYVVINDINSNLTTLYSIIKSKVDLLIEELRCMERAYKVLQNEDSRKDYYLEIRTKFNLSERDIIKRSAMLLFLNRTCFNGLYRENSKGHFNVPFGRYANPTICNEDLLKSDSELLNQFDVTILTGDYKETKDYIRGDLLNFFYFDPPYRPLSATSSFNTYVKEPFNDDSQRELANFCGIISKCSNVLWMLSNADCSAKNPDDLFFETIYKDFVINRVFASRAINSNPEKRGKLTELLICNYQ